MEGDNEATAGNERVVFKGDRGFRVLNRLSGLMFAFLPCSGFGVSTITQSSDSSRVLLETNRGEEEIGNGELVLVAETEGFNGSLNALVPLATVRRGMRGWASLMGENSNESSSLRKSNALFCDLGLPKSLFVGFSCCGFARGCCCDPLMIISSSLSSRFITLLKN